MGQGNTQPLDRFHGISYCIEQTLLTTPLNVDTVHLKLILVDLLSFNLVGIESFDLEF
jgi:hypothetical protein